jgi:YbbR domain-containing protein
MSINFLKTNTLLKLTSIVLAVILWFFVVSSKRSETVIEIPVRFVNISQSLELIDYQKTISIRIEGQERLLRRLRKDDVNAVINLNGYKEGKVSYHISAEDIRIPGSFVIKNIYPSRINLTLRKAKNN